MASEESEQPAPEDEDQGGPVKSFLEHLEDLRWVLIKVVSSIVIGMTACLAGAPALIKLLKLPLEKSHAALKLEFFGPVGGFVSSMKIAFWGGITLALPFVLYFIGEFIMPALKKKEKGYFIRAFAIGGGLFVLGVMMCYFLILPIAIGGMAEYNAWLGVPTQTWRAEEYFQFAVMFMVGMGLSFEIPVILLTLVRMEIIPIEWLVKGRAYFFFGNLILCAFITPDAVSTIFMVVPVQVLLEICILIGKHWDRQKRKAEAALLAAEQNSKN